MKKILWLKKVKNTVQKTEVIEDFKEEEIVETFYEKELRKLS